MRDGELFGMVEADISVPTSWEEVDLPPITTLSLKEYFSEMTPLFGNVEIEFENIGQHMQQYVVEHELSQNKRRL